MLAFIPTLTNKISVKRRALHTVESKHLKV
jgi:hypothetical protein